MTKKEKQAYKAERDRLLSESNAYEMMGKKELARSCRDKASVYSTIIINDSESKRKKKAERLIKRNGRSIIRRAAQLERSMSV